VEQLNFSPFFQRLPEGMGIGVDVGKAMSMGWVVARGVAYGLGELGVGVAMGMAMGMAMAVILPQPI
jgi:hypothetical protein